MFEKYLNRQVIVTEKLYNGPSSMYTRGITAGLSAGMTNMDEGVLTGVNENFIELDNSILISINHIYKIRLK